LGAKRGNLSRRPYFNARCHEDLVRCSGTPNTAKRDLPVRANIAKSGVRCYAVTCAVTRGRKKNQRPARERLVLRPAEAPCGPSRTTVSGQEKKEIEIRGGDSGRRARTAGAIASSWPWGGVLRDYCTKNSIIPWGVCLRHPKRQSRPSPPQRGDTSLSGFWNDSRGLQFIAQNDASQGMLPVPKRGKTQRIENPGSDRSKSLHFRESKFQCL